MAKSGSQLYQQEADELHKCPLAKVYPDKGQVLATLRAAQQTKAFLLSPL